MVIVRNNSNNSIFFHFQQIHSLIFTTPSHKIDLVKLKQTYSYSHLIVLCAIIILRIIHIKKIVNALKRFYNFSHKAYRSFKPLTLISNRQSHRSLAKILKITATRKFNLCPKYRFFILLEKISSELSCFFLTKEQFLVDLKQDVEKSGKKYTLWHKYCPLTRK